MTRSLLIASLLIGSSPVAADGTSLRLLSTSELQTLLLGSTFTQPDRPHSFTRAPEEFHGDGTYIRHADNFEARGKYQFKNDLVCTVETKKNEICRSVSVDADGTYWISKRNGQPGLIKIVVRPIQK